MLKLYLKFEFVLAFNKGRGTKRKFFDNQMSGTGKKVKRYNSLSFAKLFCMIHFQCINNFELFL